MTEAIAGLEELKRRIASGEQKILRDAMGRVLNDIWDEVAQYPPSSPANLPGRINAQGKPLGYYERGRGWWYPVMNKATIDGKKGATRGQMTAQQAVNRVKNKGAINRAAGYKLAGGGKSEVLGKRWYMSIQNSGVGVVGVIENRKLVIERVPHCYIESIIPTTT